jgi:hypothetical protein
MKSSTTMSSLVVRTHTRQPQDEVHNDSREQCYRQHRRPEPIVEPSLPSLPYASGAPMEREQRIYHGSNSHECEQAGADPADQIAEVEEPDGEAAEDDGEVEP